MNLHELTLPVRAYWDLSPAPDDPVDAVRISRELADVRILQLSITDTGNRMSGSLPVILEQFSGKGMAVSLTLSPSVEEQGLSPILSRGIVKMVLFEVATVQELRSCEVRVNELARDAVRFGISFVVTRRNFKLIPDVAAFCLDQGINHLVFPMQRLSAKQECFVLSRGERESLSRSLSSLNREGMNVTIHDPFLWRAWHPSVEFPEGRCQAANTMIYISPSGTVYPCPTLPRELGSLRDRSLKEILLSKEKKRTRELIIAAATECRACHELDQCRGGCRGRALVMHGSLNGGDPACRG